MKEIRLYFDNESTPSKYPLPITAEDEVAKQMARPAKKRLYRYGVDFSRVTKADVVDGNTLLYHINPELVIA